MKLLSVVVPCYNVEGYLDRCLNSLVRQDIDADSYEVLAIDDGSTDGTGAICDRYAAQYPQVKAVHQVNAGQGAARNVGLGLAQGEYVWFVDGDDFVAENCFKRLLHVAQEHDLEVLAFNSRDVVENEPVTPAVCVAEPKMDVLSGAEYLSANKMCGPVWWYITKRGLIEREHLRFPEGHFLEDSPFTPGVLLSASRMSQITNVCYYYVQRSSSTMHNKSDAHRKKILGDYIFSYQTVDAVIAKHRAKLDESAYSRLCSRRDSFLYFGIVRALKASLGKEYYKELKIKNLMPLRKLDSRDFSGIKWKMLRLLLNSPALACGLAKII